MRRASRSEPASSLKKISPDSRWSRMPGITSTFSGTFVVFDTTNGCSERGGRPLTIWRAGVTENNPSSAAATAEAAGARTHAPATMITRRECINALGGSAQGVRDRDVVLASGGDGLVGPHRLE